MLLTETLAVAFSSLRANLLRSLLTMLGIIIGVGAVIAMIALGNGAQNAVKDRIARLGTTTLQINPQRVQQGGIGTTTAAKLSYADVTAIEERAMNVVGVTPQQDRPLQVVWRNKNTNVQVTGTTPNFLDVRGFTMAVGAMFTAGDDRGRRRVAVLGADVLPMLDVVDPQTLIGEPIRIAGRQFTVIGVMAKKGTTGFGDNDEQILIPFSAGRFGIFGTDRINDIWARVASEDSVAAAMGEIQLALRRTHRIPSGRPDDFSVRNQADVLETLNEATQTFTISARRHRRGVAARRRHRHHEHHAGLGHRAHARDRHSKSTRRDATEYPHAVHGRSGRALSRRRRRRDRDGVGQCDAAAEFVRLEHGGRSPVRRHSVRIRRGGRRRVRRVAGTASCGARSDRRVAVRIGARLTDELAVAPARLRYTRE